MKKSEYYKKAQLAVIRDENFSSVEKREILQVLFEREKVEKLLEESEAGDVGKL